MVVIGILASITMVVYSGIQTKAHDVSVESDLDRLDALETNYGLKNNTGGEAYYSLDGTGSDLGFTPSDGNVVRVVVNSTDYCIRGYNTNGSKNSINNSFIKESTPGACGTLVAIALPSAPVVAVSLVSTNVAANITPVSCSTGTIQYGIQSRTDDGTWSNYTDWSSNLTYSQPVTEGMKYGYQAQTRCYVDDALYSSAVAGSEATYQQPVNAPTTPSVAVAPSGGNVQATASGATCTAGTAQYAFNNRTNDGSWAGYSAWATNTTTSQSAAEGVKYGYMPQARCYYSATSYSTSVAGTEGTYVQPITTMPAAPTVSWTANVWPNTVYSWTTPTCPSGSSATYQYDYTYTGGYDSGWQLIAGNSVSFSTSTSTYTYSLSVQAECYNSYTNGSWGASGSTSYYRSNSAIAWAIGGGAKAAASNAGDGGGGGAYASKTIVLPAQSYAVVVGAASGDSYFINTGTVLAKGGGVTAGGNSASCVGDVKYSGGNGGTHYNASYWGGGGGGGAAGPDGPGINGVSSPTNGNGGAGGRGDNNLGGVGGPLGGLNVNGQPGSANPKGGGGGAGIYNNGYGGAGGAPGGGGGGGNVGGNIGAGAGTAGQVQIYYPTGSMSGTGGTITTSGGYTYHTFTGSGTFQVY